MRTLIAIGYCLLLFSCTKFNSFPKITNEILQTLPTPSVIDVSYSTVGNVRIKGVTSSFLFDTLHLSASDGTTSIKIWMKTKSGTFRQDSTYLIDGRNGNVQLFDRQGNIVGTAGSLAIAFYQDSTRKVFGSIYGIMNNVIEMPTVGPAYISFSNVYLPIQLR